MQLLELFSASHALTEFIDTSDLYSETTEKVEQTLKDAATAILRQYGDSDYWAGEVLDRLSNTLTELMKRELGGRMVRNMHPVAIHVVQQKNVVNAGGAVTDYYDGFMMHINVLKDWLSGTPNEFYYAVRDSGETWARKIARAFTHEMTHLEQQLRAEKKLPADATTRTRYGRGNVVSRPAVRGADPYLSKKNEITAHALNAAQEMADALGGAEGGLRLFRRDNTLELKQWIRDGDWLMPHFSQYMKKMPDNAARRRFLKLVYQNLMRLRRS